MPEGLHLDYKRDAYGTSDADKRELLKDVSAFANVNGGHIVIGMDEAEGVASNLCGIKPADIDVEVSRLDQIIRTGIEPRIPGYRLKSVRLAKQSHAIVIRIPRSWQIPHRVCAQNSNRFFVRNSAGAHEASMDELRHLYTLSASAADRTREFRDERIELFNRANGQRPLIGNGRFILHIIPLSAVSSTVTINPEKMYARHASFAPLGSMGMSPRYNLDGVINERGGETNHGYTQIFRNGIVEATEANLVHEHKGRNGIAGLRLEHQIFDSLPRYIDGLKTLDVDPPLILMFTLEGVKGAFYHVYNDMFFDELEPFDRDVVRLPACLIEEYSVNVADYHRAVRPAFDALWNAVGFSKSRFFNETTGLWNGR